MPLNEVLDTGGVSRRPSRELTLLVERVDLLVGVAKVLEHLAVVLAEARRGSYDLGRVLLEDVRDADALHLAEALVIPLDDVLASLVLRILLDVGRAVSALARDTGLVEDLLDLVAGVLGAELRAQLVRLLAAGVKQREAGAVLRDTLGDAGLAHADDRIAAGDRALADDGDEHGVAFLRVVEGEAGSLVALVAGAEGHGLALLRVALVEPVGRVVVEQAEHGVVLGNVAGIAFAAVLRVDVAGEGHHAGVVSGDVVGQVRVDLQRAGRRGDAVHIHVAAHGLTGNVVGGLVLGRAELAVAGHVHDGELLVVLPADLIGQAALGVGARTAGLDPDVGPLDALEEDLLAGGAGGVDGDGVLVAVVLAPRERAAGLAGDGRSLSLQDLRAHLGHEAAGEGAGNVRAGDEDLNALEDAERRILVEFLSQFVVDFFHVR